MLAQMVFDLIAEKLAQFFFCPTIGGAHRGADTDHRQPQYLDGRCYTRCRHTLHVRKSPVCAAWTPAGDRLSYRINHRRESSESRSMAAGEERLFTAAEWSRSWSPDGKLLAYTTPSLATKGDIWVVAREPDAEPLPVARTGFRSVPSSHLMVSSLHMSPTSRSGMKSTSRPIPDLERKNSSPPTPEKNLSVVTRRARALLP